MYIKTINGEPVEYTIQQLRKDNPNTSFPRTMTDEMLAVYSVFSVTELDMPEYDPSVEKVIQQPVTGSGSEWVMGWDIVPLSPEEVEARRKALVPNSVTKRQGRQQMILMGIIDQVQTAIDAIPDPTQKTLVQSFWDDSTQYERNHPQMIQLAQAIGLTDEQLDQAFIEASSL